MPFSSMGYNYLKNKSQAHYCTFDGRILRIYQLAIISRTHAKHAYFTIFILTPSPFHLCANSPPFPWICYVPVILVMLIIAYSPLSFFSFREPSPFPWICCIPVIVLPPSFTHCATPPPFSPSRINVWCAVMRIIGERRGGGGGGHPRFHNGGRGYVSVIVLPSPLLPFVRTPSPFSPSRINVWWCDVQSCAL